MHLAASCHCGAVEFSLNSAHPVLPRAVNRRVIKDRGLSLETDAATPDNVRRLACNGGRSNRLAPIGCAFG